MDKKKRTARKKIKGKEGQIKKEPKTSDKELIKMWLDKRGMCEFLDNRKMGEHKGNNNNIRILQLYIIIAQPIYSQ